MTTKMIEAESSEGRFVAFNKLIVDSMNKPVETLLQEVNHFFNFNIEYGQDTFVWGKKEYWASVDETLTRGAGDCDDIAIAKYQTLQILGVDNLKLGNVTCDGKPHMVLIADEFILDSIIDSISKTRPDISIIYTFNDVYLWAGDKVVSAPEHLSQWKDLLVRVGSLTA